MRARPTDDPAIPLHIGEGFRIYQGVTGILRTEYEGSSKVVYHPTVFSLADVVRREEDKQRKLNREIL